MSSIPEGRFSTGPVKNEAESQSLFQNVMNRELGILNGYEEVAVLVVRWDDDLDDPRFKDGHDHEVKRLKQVFGDRFHFDVSSEVRLSTTKKPQNILNKAITDHIDAFDGPNNLLIIYYTGHGSLLRVGEGQQDLQLAATANSHRNLDGSHSATAIWAQAEWPLIHSAEADVLSLLDCCYAANNEEGRHNRERGATKLLARNHRIYELLFAHQGGQITRAPGPNSFTTRLLDALEDLLNAPKDPIITPGRVEKKINTRSDSTQNLIPVVLLSRLMNHLGREIQLSPLQKSIKQENERIKLRPQAKSIVQLLFHLEVDELSDYQIEKWAYELAKLRCSPAQIPISQINWMRLDDREVSRRWKDALNFAQLQNKKRKRVLDVPLSDDKPPSAKRRTQEYLLSPEDDISSDVSSQIAKPRENIEALNKGSETIDSNVSSSKDLVRVSPPQQPASSSGPMLTSHILPDLSQGLEINWRKVWSKIPDRWRWDLEYAPPLTDAKISNCWTCTPSDPFRTKSYPLSIASAPVVLPVEYRWPPQAGLNPPPDPRPLNPIDCQREIPLDVVYDMFLTFKDSLGFYVLINGLLQVIIPEKFDMEWASSHLPHKYGGLRVCYILRTMEPTMQQSSTSTVGPVELHSKSPFHLLPNSQSTGSLTKPSLQLNDLIEARSSSISIGERFSGRIGLRVIRDAESYILMSTHVITEVCLPSSRRKALLRALRTISPTSRPEDQWNKGVELRAGNEKIGSVHETFDPNAGAYPLGFPHDVSIVRPQPATVVTGIVSPVKGMGWLNHDTWVSLRRQNSIVKILGSTLDGSRASAREVRTIKCSLPSEIRVVGEGIFRNQNSAGKFSLPKDHNESTWKEMVSRALLYRIHPDLDPPHGYSGIALYADGVRQDGTEGPGIVGFQSFIQRSGHVQHFEMEGVELEHRLEQGQVAFYGAFEVPDALKNNYIIA